MQMEGQEEGEEEDEEDEESQKKWRKVGLLFPSKDKKKTNMSHSFCCFFSMPSRNASDGKQTQSAFTPFC